MMWMLHNESSTFGVTPNLRRMEGEHDGQFGNACRDEFGGNALLCAVTLDPELPVNNVDVDQTAVHTCVLVPAHGHEQVVVRVAVTDDLGVNVTVGVWNVCIRRQHLLHDVTVCI